MSGPFDPVEYSSATSGGALTDVHLAGQSGYAGPPQWPSYYQASPRSARTGALMYSVALGFVVALFLTLGTSPPFAIAGGFIPVSFWILWMMLAELRRGAKWSVAKFHLRKDTREWTRSKRPQATRSVKAGLLGFARKSAPGRHLPQHQDPGDPLSDAARSAIVNSGRIKPAHVDKGCDPIADLLDPKVTMPNLIRLLGELTDPNGLGYSLGLSCVRSGHHDDSGGSGGHWEGLSVDVTVINGNHVPENLASAKQLVLDAIKKEPLVSNIGLPPRLFHDEDIARAKQVPHPNILVFKDTASHVHLGAR
jgi:hypothetical protein